MQETVIKTLDVNEKPNVGYCISNELRDQQILINIKKPQQTSL